MDVKYYLSGESVFVNFVIRFQQKGTYWRNSVTIPQLEFKRECHVIDRYQ